jgi:predicted transcriptional regulator YdeE/catechol 2,3-dioxygenase-like lactoylglutathione lyase family enzyme
MTHTHSSSVLPAPRVNGRLVTRPAFHVVGLPWKATDQGPSVAEVCAQARQRLPEIRDAVNLGFTVGVSTHDANNRFIEYVFGRVVATLDAIPLGMVGLTVPEQTYAVLTYCGPLPQLHTSTHYADLQQWLKQQGLHDAIAEGAPWFEEFDEVTDPTSAAFTMRSFVVLPTNPAQIAATALPRFLRFEGGWIESRGDRSAASAWYQRHLGFSLLVDDGLQAVLRFAGGNGLPLVSAQTPSDLVRSHRGRVRFCLECPDVTATHAALQAEGVVVEPMHWGPDGAAAFDCYDLAGTRLTLTAAPAWQGPYPQTRVVRYGAPRIPVRNLARALRWYRTHLEVDLLAIYPERQALLLVVNQRTPFWLEEDPWRDEAAAGPQFARYFLGTQDIQEAYGYCVRAGLQPSPIATWPAYPVSVFAFCDPDGNQLNVWHYVGVEQAWNTLSTQDAPFPYHDATGQSVIFVVSHRPIESYRENAR